MKANELMLGDWVLDTRTGTPLRVNPFMAEFEVPEWQPIPLTVEILEKNGFEDTMGDAFWISTSCNLLWEDGKLQNFCREEDDEVCIPCEYVHELQNALRLCKVNKEIVL